MTRTTTQEAQQQTTETIALGVSGGKGVFAVVTKRSEQDASIVLTLGASNALPSQIDPALHHYDRMFIGGTAAAYKAPMSTLNVMINSIRTVLGKTTGGLTIDRTPAPRWEHLAGDAIVQCDMTFEDLGTLPEGALVRLTIPRERLSGIRALGAGQNAWVGQANVTKVSDWEDEYTFRCHDPETVGAGGAFHVIVSFKDIYFGTVKVEVLS